ncbi:unnamed protein product [Choristocarpus tenellus]
MHLWRHAFPFLALLHSIQGFLIHGGGVLGIARSSRSLSSLRMEEDDEIIVPALLPQSKRSESYPEVFTFTVKEGMKVKIDNVDMNEKLTLAFTCNLCDSRSMYSISRVAYYKGIVICYCQGCSQKHLIADNLGKMDVPWFGRNIEEFMARKGTPVKRIVLSENGFGSVEARLPGVHYPHDSDPGDAGYVGKTVSPDGVVKE